MRSKIIMAVSVAFALMLTGCNTVAGAGKDLSRAGNAISNAAEK
ncbi:entericidin A/B family lipoprotein [Achromobacter aloeverae]|uniref:Entericidin n=1 Tax=Achromobacter aloeverae TaxID=1750518 RepID=A0A4Q1HPG2_9BURK|nr:entericidin A/B family lipoprotein [Achromobacter aloeverae]RXN92908.1 entericidin [Achromobacter aloeverae]